MTSRQNIEHTSWTSCIHSITYIHTCINFEQGENLVKSQVNGFNWQLNSLLIWSSNSTNIYNEYKTVQNTWKAQIYFKTIHFYIIIITAVSDMGNGFFNNLKFSLCFSIVHFKFKGTMDKDPSKLNVCTLYLRDTVNTGHVIHLYCSHNFIYRAKQLFTLRPQGTSIRLNILDRLR